MENTKNSSFGAENTKNSSFTIIDADTCDGDVDDQCKCVISLEVEYLNYGNNRYLYKLTYTYQYSNDESDYLNPFYQCDSGKDGVIVTRNKLTDSMIEYLLMSDSDLSPLTGHIHPTDYKAAIMRSLSLLWD